MYDMCFCLSALCTGENRNIRETEKKKHNEKPFQLSDRQTHTIQIYTTSKSNSSIVFRIYNNNTVFLFAQVCTDFSFCLKEIYKGKVIIHRK